MRYSLMDFWASPFGGLLLNLLASAMWDGGSSLLARIREHSGDRERWEVLADRFAEQGMSIDGARLERWLHSLDNTTLSSLLAAPDLQASSGLDVLKQAGLTPAQAELVADRGLVCRPQVPHGERAASGYRD
jgi:hypothetical protein